MQSDQPASSSPADRFSSLQNLCNFVAYKNAIRQLKG